MEYSWREEIANAITHGIGVLISAAALVLMVVFAAIYGDAWHVVSFSIFGSSMVLLYLFSTLLHSFKPGKAKDFFEVLDHSAIYLLIAGTYTPYLLVTLRGPLGWTMFGIIWGLAFAGIIFKIYFVKRFIVASTVVYIFMGWLIVFAFVPLVRSLSFGGILWLVIGGLLYTFGTIFYLWRRIPYHHAIWHIFVLAGSITHVISVMFYVLPLAD